LATSAFEETDANSSIEWKGHDCIEGAAFVFVDWKTRGPRIVISRLIASCVIDP